MEPLPIDPYIPAIISSLKSARNLVLSAAPGIGKTTRVPRALYDAGFAQRGEILILEPRRLAARLAAARVAEELGEKLGDTVGYSIRFENVSGPHTRIRFLTEAILARRIVQDPSLEGVSVVILDEFHERHIATDLTLALLNQLQTRKTGLKIIVMSATLDAGPITSFLSGTQLMSIAGSLFDVTIDYEEKSSDRPLHEKVASAVLKLSRSGIRGDILVFLPGAAEIRRATQTLQLISERLGFVTYPLHGSIPSSEQAHAIEPSKRQKVILATNVAETSITIPGIASVIDSGLAQRVAYSFWSGLPNLTTAKISKSSAVQRAGRAGRTQAGQVLRLYTRHDFETRPEHEIPEIRRADLAETVLMLHGAGIQDVHSFTWFDPPPKAAIEAAENILLGLGAINREGKVTAAGHQMLKLPVHPRLARLVLEGEKLNVSDESSLLAALLSERDIRLNFRSNFGFRKRTGIKPSGQSDLVNLLECFRAAEQSHFDWESLQALELDPGAVHAVKRAHQHLRRLLGTRKPARHQPPETGQTEEAIMIAALAAFPDRVARRRKAGGREVLLAEGGMAVLSPDSIVHQSEFMIAVDAEEKRESAPSKSQSVLVRLASAIEVEWLAELFPEAIIEKSELVWNKQAGRVDEMRKTTYRQITLEEIVRPASRSPEAAQMLASEVLAKDLYPIRDSENLPEFRARLSLLARHFPEDNLPGLEESSVHQMVKRLCENKISMAELSSFSLVGELMDALSARQRSLLAREAPERIKLNRGRTVKVHYELSKPPWIESRLQDFFGMQSTPAVCGGRVPLTLHLLAPNGRAVQVTQDLAGFWKRHYPCIRKELMRRYPKHSWPE